ncbi:MAG TPA: radical SAM protein [Bryobacteraceae bacterium]|nr:radical SAM protein [Bryobacteraceae bacterium]
MRLLLTHGFFLSDDPKEQQILRPYPPLGILYISAYLRSRGFEVDVYDSTWGSREELFRLLDQGPPAMLGLYVNLLTRRSALAIIEHARSTGWKVIVGGPEPANYAEEYLSAGADYVVPGEGEVVMERLLMGEHAPDGVIYRDSYTGIAMRTPPAPQIPDLDSLPWPDRGRIDIHRYLSAWRERHGVGSVSLITARGCPYSCRWCSHSTYGKTHRRRSPAGVADEAAWILDQYRPEMLWYADDVFTIHHGWTLQYAAELKRRDIRIPFECITRADRMNPRIADTLAEMGCQRVWIGSESGSQRVLDAMERGVRVEQVQEAVAMARTRGIQAGMFLMWGYEGEQIDDIEATVEHVKQCRPDVFLTTVSYPIKGTGYYNDVRDKLVRIGEWSTSTDRDWQVRGRHSRRYFQFADDLLRSSMEAAPDSARIAAARNGLRAASAEVEV